jgi:hypothetical protein
LSVTILSSDGPHPQFRKPKATTDESRYYPMELVQASAINLARQLLGIKNTVIGRTKCGKNVTIHALLPIYGDRFGEFGTRVDLGCVDLIGYPTRQSFLVMPFWRQHMQLISSDPWSRWWDKCANVL